MQPRRSHASLLLVATVAAACLGACRSPSGGQAEGAYSEPAVEGSAHRPHTERVVSLVPSVTEQLYAIGAGDLVVARSQHCNHPAEVALLPSVGSGFAPDVERILALEPTLVVASELQESLPALEVLRDAGVEVLVLPDAELGDVGASLHQLGARLGRDGEADAVARAFSDALQSLADATDALPPVRTALVVGRDPIYAAGADSRLDEVLRLAGGTNVVDDGDWVQLDAEALIALAPDVIVEPSTAGDASWWARWDAIPAVASGRLCQVDADEVARSGPRLADAAWAIARCLHPELPLDDSGAAQ